MRFRKRFRTHLLRMAAVFCFLMMLLPIFFVCWLSFFSNAILSFPPEGYTLKWFAALCFRPYLPVEEFRAATLGASGARKEHESEPHERLAGAYIHLLRLSRLVQRRRSCL
jgi:ABC-type sugar transport system permease subunit